MKTAFFSVVLALLVPQIAVAGTSTTTDCTIAPMHGQVAPGFEIFRARIVADEGPLPSGTAALTYFDGSIQIFEVPALKTFEHFDCNSFVMPIFGRFQNIPLHIRYDAGACHERVDATFNQQ